MDRPKRVGGSGWWLPALLLAVLAMNCAMVWSMGDVRSGMDAILAKDRQTMTTTWQDEDGVTHDVTTVRNPGESVPDFQQRHFDAVRLAQDTYPPAK